MDPDLIAGSVGGCLAKLFDYPADTVKVLLQSQQSQRMTAWSCLQATVRERGVASLYQGITSPLIGAVAENAVLFWAYAGFQRLLTSPDKHELTTWQRSCAGAGAGFAVSFVLTPVELVKCRMQVQNAPNVIAQYEGPWDVLTKTWRREGIRGLFRGHASTMLREIPGNFCFFGVYELVCQLLLPEGGTREKDLDVVSTLTAGSLSGIAYWTAFFPADTVKTVMQTRQLAGADVSFTRCFAEMYRAQGIRGLYRGYGITIARAAPATAIIFVGYEYTLKLLTGRV